MMMLPFQVQFLYYNNFFKMMKMGIKSNTIPKYDTDEFETPPASKPSYMYIYVCISQSFIYKGLLLHDNQSHFY